MQYTEQAGTLNVTLKKFEVSKANSQETLCYSAEVYIDGSKALTARNDGWGGPDFYDKHAGAGLTALDTYCAANEFDYETFMAGVLDRFEMAQEVKRIAAKLKKRCATYVVIRDLTQPHGSYREIKYTYGAANAKQVAEHVAFKYPNHAILNEALAADPNLDIVKWLGF